jgi:uncharacterized protein YwgA
MGSVTSSKDLLMLLLYAKGHRGEQCEPIVGRTRLVKMVFLFDKELRRTFNLDKVVPESVIPEFEPYHYGPFSAQVYTDAEFLVEMGFVSVRDTEEVDVLPEELDEYEHWQAGGTDQTDEPTIEEVFALTQLGGEFVSEGEAGVLSAEQWAALDRFKAVCTATPLRTFLRYIYTKYPDYTTRSKIREQVLG